MNEDYKPCSGAYAKELSLFLQFLYPSTVIEYLHGPEITLYQYDPVIYKSRQKDGGSWYCRKDLSEIYDKTMLT